MIDADPRFLVIPSAGLGIRMKPVHPDLPKEMLPVLGKPAIQYAVEEGLSSGITNIVIIINREKEIIREYFESKKIRERQYPLAVEKMEEISAQCSLYFLYQNTTAGESDAVSLARSIVNTHCLAIMYPDNIYFPSPGALTILKKTFKRFRQDITALMEVTEENAPGISNSGRVDLIPLGGDIYRIERLYPKAQGSFSLRYPHELRTCGISISFPQIFDFIEKARETVKEGELTDGPVRKLQLQGKGLLGYRLPGTVFDIGNPKGYELCVKKYRG